MWEVPRNPKFDLEIKDYKLFPIPYLMRWDLLILLIRQYKLKTIVEVGTYNGDTAKRILREHCSLFEKGTLAVPLQFDHYYMVDQGHKSLIELQKQYPEICTFIHKTSIEASKAFEDKTLDMVFIDACHWYKDCKPDMEAWLPKVKKGGWFTGHDYYMSGPDAWHKDVKKAVNEILGEKEYYIFPDVEPWGRGCTFMARIM